MKRGKRAVAPVITTILLVLIVLVLAGIIITWGLSFIPEKVAKFGGPIENACTDVGFTAEYSGSSSKISVANTGDVPIYRFRIKEDSQARSDISDSEELKLKSGDAAVLDSIFGSGSEITLIPVLLGETDSGKIQQFSCPSSSWQIIET